MPELLPVSVVMRILNVKEWTVRRLISRGELEAVNCGTRLTRVLKSSVQDYLNKIKLVKRS